MSTGIIYKATNVKTNKSYIGKTVKSLKIRINQHKNLSINGSQTYFHRAIRKYDFVNFEWSILFKGECSDNKLNDIEIFYIGYYDTFNGVGYNMTIGGDGASSGQNHVYSKANTTKEFRKEMGKRISNALKNRTIEKKIEHDKRISDSWNTKSLDEKSIISGKQWETKYKNKEKLEESNRKISKANSGKNSSSAKKWLIISPEGKELERCEKVAEGEGILVVEKSYAYDNFSSKNYKSIKMDEINPFLSEIFNSIMTINDELSQEVNNKHKELHTYKLENPIDPPLSDLFCQLMQRIMNFKWK